MKKPNPKKTKEPREPIQKDKAMALPLNEQELAMIEKWKQGEREITAPVCFDAKITPETTQYVMDGIGDRGSATDRANLACAALCEATGSKNTQLAMRLFDACKNATGMMNPDKPKEMVGQMNVILDALYALKPEDVIAGMLVTQLVSLHFQSMNYLTSSSNNNLSPQVKDMHVNRAIKLGRLFNEKLEALQRYLRKGTQQVLVQHMKVESGAQAIVGNVQTGGGGFR